MPRVEEDTKSIRKMLACGERDNVQFVLAVYAQIPLSAERDKEKMREMCERTRR